jgi:hypothetical protein
MRDEIKTKNRRGGVEAIIPKDPMPHDFKEKS